MSVLRPFVLAVNGRGQRPEASSGSLPVRCSAGSESLLPQAIIVRLHLAAKPSVESVELFLNLLVRRVVRLRCHEPQQFIEVVERVPDDMLSIDELRLAKRPCQLGTSKRVVEHQLPLARLEANRDLLPLLDLLPQHRTFLTEPAQRAGGSVASTRSAAAPSWAASFSEPARPITWSAVKVYDCNDLDSLGLNAIHETVGKLRDEKPSEPEPSGLALVELGWSGPS